MRKPVQLPPSFQWLEIGEGAYLRHHFGTVASVTLRDGRYRVLIQWPPHYHDRPVASQALGRYYAERWLEARGWICFTRKPKR